MVGNISKTLRKKTDLEVGLSESSLAATLLTMIALSGELLEIP